jgi:hypothetical protein
MAGSGIEPGRPHIEWQDAEYVSVGAVILNEHGQEFVVTGSRTDLGIVLLMATDDHGREHAFTDASYRVRRMDL